MRGDASLEGRHAKAELLLVKLGFEACICWSRNDEFSVCIKSNNSHAIPRLISCTIVKTRKRSVEILLRSDKTRTVRVETLSCSALLRQTC